MNQEVASRRLAARRISLAVVEELRPEEFEIALGFIDPWIETADGGEFLAIDSSSDFAGGFGSTDGFLESVVSVVVGTLAHLEFDLGNQMYDLQVSSEKMDAVEEKIARTLVGSGFASEEIKEIQRHVRRATLREFANS